LYSLFSFFASKRSLPFWILLAFCAGIRFPFLCWPKSSFLI
jgi:hypothetical protein